MSGALVPVPDPFALDTLDEAAELRALARALQMAEGFKLVFARCNQPRQRERLAAALHVASPQLDIQEIHFREPISHLLDALRGQIRQPAPDAVFVSGLENSLPIAAQAHATPLIANMNAVRNSFPLVVPCPLVLWVPDYVLTAILRGAPDFFSIRSGVYFFATAPDLLAETARSLTAGDDWLLLSLPRSEKEERLAHLQTLLAEYQALPPEQRDHRAEIRLLQRQGNLHSALGDYPAAREAFGRALEIAQQLRDGTEEALAWHQLGTSDLEVGDYAAAREKFNQALQIYHQMGDRSGEAATWHQLGTFDLEVGDYAAAREKFERSLATKQQIGDRYGEALTWHQLGTLDLEMGDYAAAREKFNQALQICQQIGDYAGEAATWHQLASLDLMVGGYATAREKFNQALQIYQQIGNRAGEAATWHQLASLDLMVGDYAAAREKFERSLATKQQIGDRYGEALTWHQLGTLDLEMGDYAAARGKLQRSLETKQEIGTRYGEAATFYQLARLAAAQGRAAEAARLLAVCYLIEREIDHGDAEKAFRALEEITAQLGYGPEQVEALIAEAAASYAADRGQALLAAAFGRPASRQVDLKEESGGGSVGLPGGE